jgi:isoleucyl-tRNA synthetase
VTLTAEELDVRVQGRAGLALAQDGPYGVALDLEITPELRAEGAAREIVRIVQELRKSSGLAVEDRILLWLDPSGDTSRAALAVHRDYIAREVLATELHTSGDGPEGARVARVDLDGEAVTVALLRAKPAATRRG